MLPTILAIGDVILIKGRNVKINNIDHVGIRVMNFDRSIRFYEKLGFSVTREDYKEHVVVVKHPSGIELNLLDSANNDHEKQNVLMDIQKKYPGYTHYAIQVDSTEDAKEYFESIGIALTEGPVTFGDGKTSVFIRDPDLNVIEFTQI